MVRYRYIGLRVQDFKVVGRRFPMIRYLAFWVIVTIVQVLGKYMIIRDLDP